MPREEPEKIKIWREQQEVRLKEKGLKNSHYYLLKNILVIDLFSVGLSIDPCGTDASTSCVFSSYQSHILLRLLHKIRNCIIADNNFQ